MYTISKKVYLFLTDVYEREVSRFFDDPNDYADIYGYTTETALEELKEIGEELEIDMMSLVSEEDIKRLKESDFDSDEEDLYFNDDLEFADLFVEDKPNITSKDIEERFKKSQLVGEWTTFELEEE